MRAPCGHNNAYPIIGTAWGCPTCCSVESGKQAKDSPGVYSKQGVYWAWHDIGDRFTSFCDRITSGSQGLFPDKNKALIIDSDKHTLYRVIAKAGSTTEESTYHHRYPFKYVKFSEPPTIAKEIM